jgi:hypothetical protein
MSHITEVLIINHYHISLDLEVGQGVEGNGSCLRFVIIPVIFWRDSEILRESFDTRFELEAEIIGD